MLLDVVTLTGQPIKQPILRWFPLILRLFRLLQLD